MEPENIGILCGFAAEAAIARTLTPHVAMSGAREDIALARAEELVKNGARALLSFGVAGGMAENVEMDALFIPSIIKASDNRAWQCDTALMGMLKKAAPEAKDGAIYGSKFLVPNPAEKKKLYAAHGCAIVDMESHVVAIVASRHNIPFAVLRGVSDGADDSFPDAALKGIREDGSTNIPAVLCSLACNPFQLPALLHLFKNTGAALARLQAVLNNLKPV